MNSKFSNQDLVDATLEIYNRFDEKITTPTSQKPDSKIQKSTLEKIDLKLKTNENSPLVLNKEVKDKKQKNILKNIFNEEKLNDEKITNQKRLEVYEQKKSLSKNEKNILAKKIERKVWSLLRLNKIIKFENNKYLLLHKINNSDLKIVKMKSPNL
tara:strand:+ start:148 stop:615 length:468 start_codon:yes stop_codon:yes gene_type:complete